MRGLSSIPLLAVWRRLGGAEPRRDRAPAFWRRSHDFNISLNLTRSVWYDHAAASGGGVLALVQTVRGCDRREAVAWLLAEGFLAVKTWSPAEKRKHVGDVATADAIARDILWWRDALIVELNSTKVRAFESLDYGRLARAAGLCHLLENGSPQAIACEFARQRRTEPGGVARLINIGRNRDAECSRLAYVAVAIVALAPKLETSRAI
jgi:hypothetical protein